MRNYLPFWFAPPRTRKSRSPARPRSSGCCRIRDGDVRTVAGKEAEATFESALIRQDGAVAYPVRDGIPVMLVEEGLAVGHLVLAKDSADGGQMARATV